MQLDFLDRYSRLDSPLHRLGAGTKLGCALAMVIAVILLPPARPVLLLVPTALLLTVAAVSRIPGRFLVRRLILLEPFVLGVAILALFGPGGWRLFLVLVAKCTLCLATMVLLSNTTPFASLLRVLRAMRVPGLLVMTLSLMYRYLFVLTDEAQRMKRARMSRTFKTGRTWTWHTMSTVVSQLFVRASERAERIYAAMCARGAR